MNSFILKSCVHELNFAIYQISLLYNRRIFKSYNVMFDLIDTFGFISTTVPYGSSVYNYVFNKICFYYKQVNKLKESHIHASNFL